MREIKFRAWHPKRGMLSWEYLVDMWGMDDIEDVNAGDSACVIEQYTGLKDKNGVEIYEGDIVRWDDGSSGKYWRVAKVVWDVRGQWKYQVIRSQCVGGKPSSDYPLGHFIYTPDSTLYGNVLEVIGNIHETPKLSEAS